VSAERRSGTSCHEAIHVAVENAKTWNYARICLATGPVFAILLLNAFVLISVPLSCAGKLAAYHLAGTGTLAAWSEDGPSARHPNTNQ